MYFLAFGYSYSQSLYLIQIKDSIPLIESEKICLSEMNKFERGGKNTGEHIANYHKFIGLNYKNRYAYCAMGQCYCYKDYPIFKFSAGANQVFNNFKKDGTAYNFRIEKHYFIVWKNINNNFGHIGRIKTVLENGWVLTYEFNTSPEKGNQRDGDGNYIKKRNVKHVLGRMRVRGLCGFIIKKEV